MPDTGAPWNIPYVEATDLVRDWPTDSEALADAIADGLDAAGNAGIGSNVVSTTKTDVLSVSIGSNSWSSNVTGLEVTITPTSAASKVLLIVSLSAQVTSLVLGAYFRFDRNGSAIAISDAGIQSTGGNSVGDNSRINTFNFSYLDSPETTSATTYGIQIYNSSGNTRTHYVNRVEGGTANFVSTITAIEVAA